MLKNSRVTGALDTGRVGQALARPGMDTRTWVSLAIVQAFKADANEGVFVDVILMPSQVQTTARLGTEYAGPGFGIYAPLEVDDEVLVEAPSGDPDHGLVVTKRLHGRSDPPPSEVVDHPNDLLVFVREGKTMRIIAGGAGNVVIEQRGAGEVRLGNESATRGVARLGDTVEVSLSDLATWGATLWVPLGIPGIPTAVGGSIVSASDKVKST